MKVAVLPHAFVDFSICVNQFALTVFHFFGPLASVDAAVRVVELAQAVLHPLNELALVESVLI